MRSTISWLWRWSLIVTVPLSCLFILWLVRTAKAYNDLGLHYGTVGDEVTLLGLAEYEGEMLERELALGLRPDRSERRHRLKPIRLYVPESSESRLDSDLPHSGKEYVPASLVYPDGALREVSLRYRGDHYWHWAGRKKSLRVKTKKKQLFERIRAINLSAPKMPDQISGHLSYFLAGQCDLVAPRAEMVDVYINGKYRGIYLFIEQLEEMVLRKHGLMPGDIYAADVIGRDAYRGLNRRAFENPGLWEKIAINNHFDEGENEAMERLVQALIAPPSEARSRAVRELIDLEAFARFAVFRTICQTEHYDKTHNWRLYYDPWRNQFQPIVWDPVGWAKAWVPKEGQWARPDIVSSNLDEALMQDQGFLAARQSALEDYFASGGPEELLAELDRVIEATRPSIEVDPGLTFKIEALSPEEVWDAQRDLRQTVVRVINHLRQFSLGKPRLEYVTNPAIPSSVRVAVRSRRTVAGLTIGLSGAPPGAVNAHIAYLMPDGPRRVDVTGALVRRGAELALDVDLAAQFVPIDDPDRPIYLSPAYGIRPGVYDVILSGAAMEGLSITEVRGRLTDESSVRGHAVPRLRPSPFTNARIVVEPNPEREPLVWEGELQFEGVTRVEEDVTIRPGTVLNMGPDASVIFEGRLLARGTKEHPILVQQRSSPPDDGTPWGVLALRGEGADNSELVHVRMVGGSGLKTPMAEFSAMLSIHDVDGILVRDCVFEDSQVVDDMVHAVYSTVRFERCTFTRSLFDALDLDITTGTVDSCRFLNSGNDALDLMTSTILIRDCWIEGSVDKGISVGEDTEAMIFRTKLKNCEIGIQIKDRSRAVALHCEIEGNRFGVDAYKKNWRYDSGGFGYIYKSMIVGNGVELSADKSSQLKVHDSGFDEPVESSKRIAIDGASTFGGERAARVRRLARFAEEAAGAAQSFQGVWQSIDLKRRGIPRQPAR